MDDSTIICLNTAEKLRRVYLRDKPLVTYIRDNHESMSLHASGEVRDYLNVLFQVMNDYNHLGIALDSCLCEIDSREIEAQSVIS